MFGKNINKRKMKMMQMMILYDMLIYGRFDGNGSTTGSKSRSRSNSKPLRELMASLMLLIKAVIWSYLETIWFSLALASATLTSK